MSAPPDPNAPNLSAPAPAGRRIGAERSLERDERAWTRSSPKGVRGAARAGREPPPAGPAPTRAALHEAALAYLARFAATEAGLVRVLDRRIGRWAHRAADAGADPVATQAATAAARHTAREVAHALVRAGAVDDAAYAEARARGLTRAGRSRRAVGAHLAAKGVPPELAQAALPEPDTELAAALAYARRRRLGPFRSPKRGDAAASGEGSDTPDPDAPDSDTHRREIGALARAGFPQAVARRALRMDMAEAEALVLGLKRG